jgi:hypothetical protein
MMHFAWSAQPDAADASRHQGYKMREVDRPGYS